MSYLGAIWAQVPPYVKLVGAGLLGIFLVVLVYVNWPTPGKNPAVKALEAQIADRDKIIQELTVTNGQLAIAAAQSFDAGMQFEGESNAFKAQLPAVRAKGRAVIDSARIRTDQLAATPDSELRAAHDAQLAATRAAVKRALQAGGADDAGDVPVQR